MKKINYFLFLLAAIFLSGCATNYKVLTINNTDMLAQQGKWVEAYSELECFLIDNKESKESEEIRSLLTKYPEIISVGMIEVYKQRLNEVEKNCDNRNFFNYYYKIRGLGNSIYAGNTKNIIFDNSKKVLNDCAANPQSGVWLKELEKFELIVGDNYFSSDTKKQAAITEEKETQLIKENTIGITISAQVAN